LEFISDPHVPNCKRERTLNPGKDAFSLCMMRVSLKDQKPKPTTEENINKIEGMFGVRHVLVSDTNTISKIKGQFKKTKEQKKNICIKVLN
jgi:hypothetical protein